jgi:hypothetical protein
MATIHRTHDSALLNEVANDPRVRPWLGALDGDLAAPLDLTPVTVDPSHVCLVTGHGGCVFLQRTPSVYEAHVLFRPEEPATVGSSRRAVSYMFTETACEELVAMVPMSNRAAGVMARLAGFTERSVEPDAYQTADGWVDISVRTLARGDWARGPLADLSGLAPSEAMTCQ